ncbi:MAG: hypothetical protein IPK01_11525 [Acidobacteria bacterium]|nr:hypothetical protein [Acidobacteriota bacterium]
MIQNLIITVLLFIFSGMFALVFGQTAEAVKPSVVTGDVVSISSTEIVVSSAAGEVKAVLTAATQFKKVTAENPSIKTAIASSAADIGVGDKLLVTGILSADGKSLPARAVYLMSKSDIAQKQAKEAENWRTRGIAGRVTAVNAQTNQLTVEIRSLMGSTSMVLTPNADAVFHRYAPDSIKFEEALNSSLAEVKQGDMIRALGDKSADGTSFSAEQVVTGAFQTIAGTVKSIDIEKNEVIITDLQTKKDVTVAIGTASMMKRFPAELAQRLAGGAMGGGGPRPPGQGQPAAGGPPTTGGQVRPAGGAPGQGRPGMGGQGGIDDMLERFPNIKAEDLKAGDIIAISSTRNGNTSRVNAIKLLAGVEPFIRLAQATSGGGRGQGGQAVQGGFTIPGLDGIGFP